MVDTNVVEIVWTITALVGAAIHVRGAWFAELDRATVLGGLEVDDNALRLIATGRLRGELIRIGVDLGFAGIGVYAITQPDAPHITVGGYVIAGVLIGCVALLVLNGLLDDRERQLLRAYVSSSS